MARQPRHYPCVICKQWKPTAAFGRHSVSRRRLVYCRECSNAFDAITLRERENYQIPKRDRSILGR